MQESAYMTRRRTVAILLSGLVALAACGSTSRASHEGTGVFRPAASMTGPISPGHTVEPLTGLNQNMPAYGYVEQEFFVSGTAHAFGATSTPVDGQWTIKPTTSAPYETRILVRRPSDPSKFNGTVVAE